jgi:hypothetical protein
MKNMKALASEIAKREGKKSQVKMGDVREILGILSDLAFADPVGVVGLLIKNGMRRAKGSK